MVGCNDPELVARTKRFELTYDEIVRRVFIPAKELNVSQISFNGGEFLLREDSIQLVRAASKMGFITGVLTNGVLIDDRMLGRLKKAAGSNLILIFGINSIGDTQINVKTRDIEPSRILRAMQLCRAHKIKRHVVVNVGRFNLHDLENTLGWLMRNNLTFNRAPFNPRNSGRAWFKAFGYTRDDIRSTIHPALRKRINGYASQTPFFLSPEVHAEVSGGKRWNKTVPQNPAVGCWCGSWISVNPEGDVAPCPLLQDELVAGNVRQKGLFEIVDKSPIFQSLMNRKLLKGRCGRCRYRLTCGGCRAMAYYHLGDYLAEDPTCPFEPEDEKTVSPFEQETNRLFRRYIRLAAWAGVYKPVSGKNRRD